MADNDIVFYPVSKPQEQFLTSSSWLTIYGGAAFAGKSMCLLGSMLPIIHDPGTRAILIRKTTKMLSGAGGLFDAAINLYSKVDSKLKIKSRDLTIVFSSGAELQFTYLDAPKDRQNLQGKEFSRILLDECQQLSSDNVFYALSRLRSTRVSYPLQAFATCNPDPDSFLMNFVEHMLDDNLVPVRQDEYKERYFVRDSRGLVFFDNYEKALECYPKDSTGETPIKSYKFIPGCIFDNPKGLESNRDYISTLRALPPTESKRLLHGAWVREQKSGFFKRDWLKFEDYPNMEATKRTRCWDLAFSEESEAVPDVDATAGVLMSKDKFSRYTVEDCVLLKKRVHDVEKAIFDTAERDGRGCIIGLPKDPGATAGAYCQDLARRLGERGFIVKLIRPEKGKLQRFLPFASVAEAGWVHIVRSDWTDDYINELEQTQFNNKTHDDRADATSDCFWVLNREMTLPSFQLPTLDSTPQQFGIQSTDYSTGLTIALPNQGNFNF